MDDSPINDRRARAFVEALHDLDENSDPATITRLFADGATVVRLDARGERTDVEQFWREYRSQFDNVSTTFTYALEGDDAFALEWNSTGRFADGGPVDYRGTTVLEMDGGEITRLRTYYDSAAFARVPATAAASHDDTA